MMTSATPTFSISCHCMERRSQSGSSFRSRAEICEERSLAAGWVFLVPRYLCDDAQSAIERQDSLTPRFGNGADVARDPPAAVHCVDQGLSRDCEHIGIQVRHHPNGAGAAGQHLLQHHELPGRYQFESDLALTGRNRHRQLARHDEEGVSRRRTSWQQQVAATVATEGASLRNVPQTLPTATENA